MKNNNWIPFAIEWQRGTVLYVKNYLVWLKLHQAGVLEWRELKKYYLRYRKVRRATEYLVFERYPFEPQAEAVGVYRMFKDNQIDFRFSVGEISNKIQTEVGCYYLQLMKSAAYNFFCTKCCLASKACKESDLCGICQKRSLVPIDLVISHFEFIVTKQSEVQVCSYQGARDGQDVNLAFLQIKRYRTK